MESRSQSSSSKYKFTQVFGTNEAVEVLEEDIISCLKYDPTGKYLCLGDNAGRVIIFQAAQQTKNSTKKEQAYDYYAEFQSHIREFDPLKGEEFPEEIVDISWLRPQGQYLKLLTTNTRSIKLWKAFEKTDKKMVKAANKDLHMPKLQPTEPAFTANEQYVFPSVHISEINSVSHSHNQQYMLSSDKDQNLLWSLQKPTRPYIANSIQDKKKNAANQVSITCSKMHPKSDSIFVYGMNRCELGLCDIRVSPTNGKVMDFGAQTRSMKNFFTDIIASVGSAEFMQNGRYIISREYLNVKIWDMHNTKKPIQNICIQESLKSKLVNLFQTDNIYDKFNVASSHDNSIILTGNYNNCFHLLEADSGVNTQYELSFKKNTISNPILPGKCPPMAKLDSKKKTSVLAFHPHQHSVAVASLNSFFIYSL